MLLASQKRVECGDRGASQIRKKQGLEAYFGRITVFD